MLLVSSRYEYAVEIHHRRRERMKEMLMPFQWIELASSTCVLSVLPHRY